MSSSTTSWLSPLFQFMQYLVVSWRHFKKQSAASLLRATYSLGWEDVQEGLFENYGQFKLRQLHDSIIYLQSSQHRERDGKFVLFHLVIEGDFDAFVDSLESMETAYQEKVKEISIRKKEFENAYREEVKNDPGRKKNLEITFQENCFELEKTLLNPVFLTDAAGATIIHIAYLYERYDIGHYLVMRYPRLGLQPYLSTVCKEILDAERGKLKALKKLVKNEYQLMPYSGENILHMTIVRRNYREVRWLLDFYKDHNNLYCPHKFKKVLHQPVPGRTALKENLAAAASSSADSKDPTRSDLVEAAIDTGAAEVAAVGSNHDLISSCYHLHHDGGYSNALEILLTGVAKGNFFDSSRGFYFGDYPLHFAVCANDTAVFDLILCFISMANVDSDQFINVHQSNDLNGRDKSNSIRNSIRNSLIGKGKNDSNSDNNNSSSNSGNNRSASEEAAVTTSTTIAQGINPIFKRDSDGNTVLHLCVLHGLKDMYQHVYNTAVGVVKRELRRAYASVQQRLKSSNNQREFILPADFEIICSQHLGFSLKPMVVSIPTAAKFNSWLKEESKRIVDERLVLALNEQLHSPLTLAAALIRKHKEPEQVTESRVAMLEFLVDHMKQPLWTFGPISTTLVDVEGFEVKYHLERDYVLSNRTLPDIHHHSAINWLCINDADAALKIPAFSKFIAKKWKLVGYPAFMQDCAVDIVSVLLLTLILIFINATPSANPGYSTEWLVNFIYPVTMCLFFGFYVSEIYGWLAYGGIPFLRFYGIAFYHALLRYIKMISFVFFCICQLLQSSRGGIDEANSTSTATVYYDYQLNASAKFFISVCVMSGWLNLYYFFMGFDATGPFTLSIARIVTRDVPYFLIFYSIVVVAFACGLSVISNNGDYRFSYGFGHFIDEVWRLLQNTLGDDKTADFIPSNLEWWSDILRFSYNAIVLILLLNLLIAMISATFEAYTTYSQEILLMERYNVMSAQAKTMTAEDKEAAERLYHANINRGSDKSAATAATSTKAVVTSSAPKATAAAAAGADTSTGATDAGIFTDSDAAALNPNTENPVASDHNSDRFSIDRRPSLISIDSESLKGKGKGNKELYRLSSTRSVFELEMVNSDWWEGEAVAKKNAEESADNISSPDADKAALEAVEGVGGYLDGSKKTTLFIIDPQIDFHPAGGGKEGDPLYHPAGSLAVPGANEDTHRIAEMIDQYGSYIHDIFVSMDSHYPCHIAHAESWRGKDGNKPAPFTEITNSDVCNGTWTPIDDSVENMDWVKHYTSSLERKTKMKLMIWPEHGVIGTRGHSVVPELNAALQRWAEKQHRVVNYVMKGQNLRTESYSILEAEVEDPSDISTSLDIALLGQLKVSDRLLICGQALTHCVKYTLEDLMEHWHRDKSSLVLLEDGCSPVQTFEAEGIICKSKFRNGGVTVCDINDVFSSEKGYTMEIPKVVGESKATAIAAALGAVVKDTVVLCDAGIVLEMAADETKEMEH